jgi:hypothetical protein
MISGKSFADLCQWVVDPRYPEKPEFRFVDATSGDWVFINGDFMHLFLGRIPYVSDKTFTLIVHNSDRPFGQWELMSLLRHADHIYAINTTVDHPRLTTIPIGFVDRQLSFLQTLQVPDQPRDIEIYGNFNIETNRKKRTECFNVFNDDPRVTWKQSIPVPEYYADLCRSTFVLCPEGTGIDTHRVYESLLCGATPVVLRNPLSHLYERLPVCIVNNWTDPFYIPPQRNFHTAVDKYL